MTINFICDFLTLLNIDFFNKKKIGDFFNKESKISFHLAVSESFFNYYYYFTENHDAAFV